jgi:hypothetical protein
MPVLPEPRWRRERGASALKAAVILAIVGVAVYGALYGYGTLRVGQIETAISRRIADAVRPTPTETMIDEALIKKRLVAMAREEGTEVNPDEIRVLIEPLNETNKQRLPMPARFAVNAVGQMKGWEADAAFCSISMTIRPKWGPVTRESVLTRDNMVPKSALR